MIPLNILTIYSPSITLNLRNIFPIYPAELQLNKANTSDKETSFLDLNIKVIGSDIHTSVHDKRDDFGFPFVIFPWSMSGDVPRLTSYGIYISQLVRFARCCTGVLDSHSKNLQITSKLLTNIDITSYEKHLVSSLDHTPNFCRNLVIFRSKNMCLKEFLTRSSTVI